MKHRSILKELRHVRIFMCFDQNCAETETMYLFLFMNYPLKYQLERHQMILSVFNLYQFFEDREGLREKLATIFKFQLISFIAICSQMPVNS